MIETLTTFGELIKSGAISVTDGYRAKNSELGGDGLIFLRAGHVTDSHIDFTGVERFHETLTQKLQEKTSRVGDVIVTTKGNSTGRTSFVDATMPIFVYSPHLSRWRVEDQQKLDRQFLRYWSRSPQFINQMRGLAGSTDMAPYLSLRDQQRLEISLPHIDHQRAVGAVLGSLDDKIEQNRRTGRKLEELARAVFKAWFVDFEPVKAKAAGATSFPGMPREAFDALPTRLVNSELGPVPEGWNYGKLGDNADINKRSVKAAEITGEIEYIDIASVAVGELNGVQRVDFTDAPSRARRRIGHGDTIWSCVRPNRRSYLFVHSPPSNRIASTGFVVISPKVLGAAYIYESTTRSEFVDYLVANADGSAYPAVQAHHFATADVLVPPRTIRDAFEESVMPLRDLLASGGKETEKLAALRDALLPKLLSGVLRVSIANSNPHT